MRIEPEDREPSASRRQAEVSDSIDEHEYVEARRVVIVGVEIPFWDLFGLLFKVTCAQAVIGALLALLVFFIWNICTADPLP